MKMLTLARICPRNIYLNLFGGAHFYWRSLKACKIAKRTCFSYVWTAIFSWSYCSLKIQVLHLFPGKSSKIIECWFTLKRQKQPPEVFCKKRRPATLLKKETLAQVFSSEFCEISKNTFSTEHLLTTASDAYVTYNNIQSLLILLL